MSRSVKLADLDIRETSGVDHPAHLHEGWLVLKSVAEGDPTQEGESIVELEVTETEAQVEEQVTEVAAAVDNQNAELLKEVGDLRKELADMRAEKEAIVKQAELAKAVETAAEFAALPGVDPQVLGEDIVKMRAELPEVAERIESILKGSAIAISEAGVLKEVGSDAAEEIASADAWGLIESQANDLVAAGEANNIAKAITIVAERDKELYNRYLSEKGL